MKPKSLGVPQAKCSPKRCLIERFKPTLDSSEANFDKIHKAPGSFGCGLSRNTVFSLLLYSPGLRRANHCASSSLESQRQRIETSKRNTLPGHWKSFRVKFFIRSYKIDHFSDFSIHSLSSSRRPPAKVTKDRDLRETTASAARTMDGPSLLSHSTCDLETRLRKDPMDDSGLGMNKETRLLLSCQFYNNHRGRVQVRQYSWRRSLGLDQSASLFSFYPNLFWHPSSLCRGLVGSTSIDVSSF